MLHFEEAPTRKARIEIIPMIDVMMFLLIFFVLISLNVIPAFGLKTTLPSSSTASKASTDEPPIIVTLGADGAVALDGQTLGKGALPEAAHSAHQAHPKRRFIINADQTVQWQNMVTAMDALRSQGIEAITFATKQAR